MTRQPRRIAMLALAAVALLGVVGPIAPAAAWSNGPSAGNGYGTHDWIIDRALTVFSGHAPAWLDVETARLASDDPDTQFWRINEHLSTETGAGRGAVDKIVQYYRLTVRDLEKGDTQLASIHVGRLAHYYADILQPFHTAYAAQTKDALHQKYELLVDSKLKSAGSMPEWQTADRTINPLSDVRTTAIAAAAYSRKFYPELASEFGKDTTTLNSRVRQLTGYVLKRASSDLANVINAIDRRIGAPPEVGHLSAVPKYRYPASDQDYQAIYVTSTDTTGKPIEGLTIDVMWPLASGTVYRRVYTDASGVAKSSMNLRNEPLYQKQTAVGTVVLSGRNEKVTAWYMATPTLAAGSAGFKTVVSDSTVVAGQTVTLTSLARDAAGRPVPGIRVTWTWDYNGRIITTSATTDADGKARTSRVISSATTHKTVTVVALTQSGGHKRKSSASFHRVD
jgi:hypothetical protein